jgi:hypothetical protein
MNNKEQQENRQTENSIVPTPVHQVIPSFPTQEDWATLGIIARTFRDGGIMPNSIDTLPKMVVALQAGREVGLSPIEALSSFYFVNGRIAMYGEAVPAQIIRAGHRITWGVCDDTTATVTITRGDTGESMSTTLTWEKAVERGYTKNQVWHRFPGSMLRWRALSSTAKFIVPDALKGIGIKEDLEGEAVNKDSRFHSEVVEARVTKEVKEGTYGHKGLDEALQTEEVAPEVVPLSLYPAKAKK